MHVRIIIRRFYKAELSEHFIITRTIFNLLPCTNIRKLETQRERRLMRAPLETQNNEKWLHRGGKNLSENKITIKHFNFQRQHFSKSGAGAGDGTTAGNCLSMQWSKINPSFRGWTKGMMDGQRSPLKQMQTLHCLQPALVESGLYVRVKQMYSSCKQNNNVVLQRKCCWEL